MKYTNKHHLSPDIYEAIVKRQSQYNPGDVDYSVTEILNPPRIVHLTKRHYDELEMDVIDVLDAWEGHLLHDCLEQPETSKRLVFSNTRYPSLSGAYDYFSGGLLKDYKRTSVWSYIFGSVQKKWEQQLNCYAWMLRTIAEETVDTVGIEVFLKDWSKNEALRRGDYPQVPQFFLRMPLWSLEEQERFVLERLFVMQLASEFSDESLDFCTDEEMWAKPTTYAVKEDGKKRALRVFTSLEEAQQYYDENGGLTSKNLFIEERPGERVRCTKYCNVNKFCNQYQEYLSNERD